MFSGVDPSLRDAVRNASARPDVRRAVRTIYDALQHEIDLRRPVCSASGRCCDFDTYGHRLYVTTMELATFVAELDQVPKDPTRDAMPRAATSLPVLPSQKTRKSSEAQGGCPFQLDRLCTVHAIRPFGCRVFFCDAAATQWQYAQYDRFHADLRRLHEELDVPYFYAEWRSALKAIGLDMQSKNSQPSSGHLPLPCTQGRGQG